MNITRCFIKYLGLQEYSVPTVTAISAANIASIMAGNLVLTTELKT